MCTKETNFRTLAALRSFERFKRNSNKETAKFGITATSGLKEVQNF